MSKLYSRWVPRIETAPLRNRTRIHLSLGGSFLSVCESFFILCTHSSDPTLGSDAAMVLRPEHSSQAAPAFLKNLLPTCYLHHALHHSRPSPCPCEPATAQARRQRHSRLYSPRVRIIFSALYIRASTLPPISIRFTTFYQHNLFTS